MHLDPCYGSQDISGTRNIEPAAWPAWSPPPPFIFQCSLPPSLSSLTLPLISSSEVARSGFYLRAFALTLPFA